MSTPAEEQRRLAEVRVAISKALVMRQAPGNLWLEYEALVAARVEQDVRQRATDVKVAAAAGALREAAEAARQMHDPVAPDCAEWADWLDARADRLARGGSDAN